MIYDCFSFFNELDILEIRLNTLDKVVDKFILVESTFTHTGNPKPLYYAKNKDRFARFTNRIIHIVVDDIPSFPDATSCEMAWIRENWQRNAIMRGVPKDAKDDDYVIISDLDEIPAPSAVAKARTYDGVSHLQLEMFYYFVNLKNYSNPTWLGGPQIAPLHVLRNCARPPNNELVYPVDWRVNNVLTPTVLRFLKPKHIIKSAGWHFSFCGGIRAIQEKIASFSHTEYDSDRFKNEAHILKCLKCGRDVFGRGDRFFALSLGRLPGYIIENRVRYNHLIFHVTLGYMLRTFTPRIVASSIGFLRTVLRPLLPLRIKDWIYNHLLVDCECAHE